MKILTVGNHATILKELEKALSEISREVRLLRKPML